MISGTSIELELEQGRVLIDESGSVFERKLKLHKRSYRDEKSQKARKASVRK